jgi:hypothetical protein
MNVNNKNKLITIRRLSIFGICLVLGLLCVFVVTKKAHAAAVFTVDDAGDDSAVDPSVGCATAGGGCTLRSSIEAVEAAAGINHRIQFNIPGAGVHTITLTSALPLITKKITIDGTTQPGASCGTLVPDELPGSSTPHTLLIEVNGAATGSNTLTFDSAASGISLKGLILNNPADGWNSLYIAGSDPGYNVQVNCNYFGTDSTGVTAQTPTESNAITGFLHGGSIQNNLISGYKSTGGQGTGIVIAGDGFAIQNNLIGTKSDGITALGNKVGIWLQSGDPNASPVTTINHNIISGNETVGIKNGQETYSGDNSTIIGNYIGVNVAGTPLGNGGDGIYSISASNFIIGGTLVTDRNIISSNGGNGIHVYSQGNDSTGCQNSTSGQIYGNYIGTNGSGEVSTGYGNQASGITFNEVDTNCSHGSIFNQVVGGDDSGEPNIIAGNSQDGVRIYQVPGTGTDVFGIAVLANNIFNNGNLGINLAADSNGSGTADTDLGPNAINDFLMSYPATNANYYINHPVINSTSYSGNQLTVNYNFQANGVQESPYDLLASNLVGYRLDFYLNDNAQDGAYAGYNQGKIHLGSFIVSGSETNATHTFTSPITLSGSQSVSTTTTVLWQNLVDCDGVQQGSGPPYNNCGPQ